MDKENTPIERVNTWIKNSVTLKLITVTILMLLLLIPSSMIKSIILERETLNNEAIIEVSSKWAEGQEIQGPILTIPLIYEYKKDDEKSQITKYWHIFTRRIEYNRHN